MPVKSSEKKIPYAPSRKELYVLYDGLSKRLIDKLYALIRSKYKLKYVEQPKCLTSYQFQKFIEELGLPHGYKKSDFPFLDHIEEKEII